jgi:preprotein translocase subunit SecF
VTSDSNETVWVENKSIFARLAAGETSFNFFGKRRIAFGFSLVLVVVTIVSLLAQGLNLGLDFKGGVAWQVPVTETMDVDIARDVLADNGIEASNAKIQILDSGSVQTIRVQVGDQPADVREKVVNDFADRAGVAVDDVSVNSVSSSWGRSITEKAVRALLIFLGLIAIYLAWRFEWRMALAAILAVVHDVVISVGIYSLFGFEVTPATVVAFLTILGYSLYDTIVVFDRVQENVHKFAGSKFSMGDISNISMNQVLMRSLNTTISSLLPVLSILILGAGVLGVVSLREFSIALFVGMLTGAYSSIYIATPLLTLFKERELSFLPMRGQLMSKNDLRHMVVTGNVSTRVRRRSVSEASTSAGGGVNLAPSPAAVLNHPPRPRKKKRR